MYEPLLAALLRKLADEPAHDARDPWPGIRDRLPQLTIRALPRRKPTVESDQPLLVVPGRSPRRLPRLVTTGVAAATIVVTLTVGLLQPWNRPSSANAAEILEGIRDEAFSTG